MASSLDRQKQRNLIRRIGEMWSNNVQNPIQEIIGRVGYRLYMRYPTRVTVDHTQADAEYWDHLRRGKKSGFEIGGLFAKPIVEIITSWTLGDSVTISVGDDNTDTELADFVADNLLKLITTHEDMLALGDAYIVVNGDGSLTMVPASMVEIIVSDEDHTQIIQATISSIDTETGIEIKDVYTAQERVRTIRRGVSRSRYGRRDDSTSMKVSEETFPNLIGRIPVIHFPNDRSANEVYGHPIYESLLTLFAEYDDVTRKGIDGVKIMGNPTPTFEKISPRHAQETDRSYQDTVYNRNGTSETEDYAEWSHQEIIYTSGEFNYKSPGNFTGNTKDILKKLFQIMLQHTQIPEWVWGGAIASSNASVDAQLPAFARFIDTRRLKFEAPLRQLVEVWLLTIALFTPNIRTDEKIVFEWSNLIPEDKEMLLEWVKYLVSEGAMTRETALRLSDTVNDVIEEIETARAQVLEDIQSEKDEIEALVQKVEKLEVPVQQAWEEMGYDAEKIAEFKRMRMLDQAMRLREASQRLSSDIQNANNENTPNDAEDVRVDEMAEMVI